MRFIKLFYYSLLSLVAVQTGRGISIPSNNVVLRKQSPFLSKQAETCAYMTYVRLPGF